MPNPVTLPARSLGVPHPHQWTCEEFHRLGDLGFFEGHRVMLINGEILDMLRVTPPHAVAISLVTEALRAAFGGNVWVRVQMPLILGRTTDPEPGVAVVAGSPRSHTAHPTTALLVVEVSESTLAYDRTDKASLYASAQLADYWIVDLVNRRLIVFRDPKPDASQPFGHGYATVTTHAPGASVTPLASSGSVVKIDDLLP